jgi:hypothetical protein
MPVEAVSAYIGLAANDIEMLTGLPENYLSGKAAVLHLAKLKTMLSSPPAIKTNDTAVVLPFKRGT